ncbi:hypothetical protein [Sphingomonas qomolangmaensis]|uniref:Fe-S oxidoreductase n=1 Tax=Sphingomonas qomolangmaensis TaxID=2918765 RepID=A0ABY5LB19_9SPHN|nr:hypothetical protein [Sphingomonas qomolangmaensis]UUL82984.1 hypothetical protein NMP03_01740 [Sphingomonas qomolangmaensis]
MKFIAMTAALALSSAAFAQTAPTNSGNMPPSGADAPMSSADAPASQGSTMEPTAPDAAQDAPPMTTPDSTMPPASPAGQPMEQQPMASGSGSMTTGGYMPAQPPMSGPAQAGATVRVQASMSPSQAFPPPAPKAEYPVCKRGQTDGCRNRGE